MRFFRTLLIKVDPVVRSSLETGRKYIFLSVKDLPVMPGNQRFIQFLESYSKMNLRAFTSAPVLQADAEMIDVTFIPSNGTKLMTKGKVGDNLLDVVVNNNIDLDGFGACEGTLACSTCHIVFKKEDFDKIEDKVTDEELDMLDLAYGLTDTSRLGCQVTLTKELAGLEIQVPAGVNDARS